MKLNLYNRTKLFLARDISFSTRCFKLMVFKTFQEFYFTNKQ